MTGPVGVEKTTFKLKLLHEILVWELSSHQKSLIIDHHKNRTELVLANQGKDNGITHIQILWKSKQVKTITNYLEGSRVFDMYKIQPPNYVTHDNLDEKFAAGGKEKCIAVFQTIHKVEVGYRMIDLLRKTESKIYSLFDASKLATFPSEFNRGKEMDLPFILLNEMYSGFRLVNYETEQIV